MSELHPMSLQRLAERIEALEAYNKKLRDECKPSTDVAIISRHISTLCECLLAVNGTLAKALERVERLETFISTFSDVLQPCAIKLTHSDIVHETCLRVCSDIVDAIRQDLAEWDTK